MDEAQVRELAEEHGRAVERGDLPAVTSDFIPEMHEAVPEIAKSLPSPPISAEVLSVDVEGEQAFVQIRYAGSDNTVTIRTTWEDRGERPLIVTGEPVE